MNFFQKSNLFSIFQSVPPLYTQNHQMWDPLGNWKKVAFLKKFITKCHVKSVALYLLFVFTLCSIAIDITKRGVTLLIAFINSLKLF